MSTTIKYVIGIAIIIIIGGVAGWNLNLSCNKPVDKEKELMNLIIQLKDSNKIKDNIISTLKEKNIQDSIANANDKKLNQIEITNLYELLDKLSGMKLGMNKKIEIILNHDRRYLDSINNLIP